MVWLMEGGLGLCRVLSTGVGVSHGVSLLQALEAARWDAAPGRCLHMDLGTTTVICLLRCGQSRDVP